MAMADMDKGVLSNLLSVLFPLKCAHCGKGNRRICDACISQLLPIGATYCRRCGKPSLYLVPDCPECRGRRLYFGTARAAFYFKGPARSLVHDLKYSGQRRLASIMADLSLGQSDLTEHFKGATLTSVPMHPSRKIRRGYNQAEMYAKALSERLGIPWEGVLVKSRPTPSQNRLDYHDRRSNIKGSFSLRPGAARGAERLMVVDDVYTTGSTASECARLIRSELGVEVDVWTFARTVKR